MRAPLLAVFSLQLDLPVAVCMASAWHRLHEVQPSQLVAYCIKLLARPQTGPASTSKKIWSTAYQRSQQQIEQQQRQIEQQHRV